MDAKQPADGAHFLHHPPDFSLVLGGPLYQLLRRTHLSGVTPEQQLGRRIVALTLLAWLPLLLLSAVEGNAWSSGLQLPFLRDVETHTRLLIALPLIILAELVVHQRLRPIVRQFVDRGLIPESARPQFDAAIASAVRLRNSIVAEIVLIVLVYAVGMLFVWRTALALDVASWYRVTVDGTFHPTLAGWWLICVSLPLFQFLLVRWYFRLFIWGRFLWQVSRIRLHLVPIHPDRCGGLGFLSGTVQAVSPLLLAQGVILAGLVANRIFYAGATLPDFKLEAVGLVVLMFSAVLGPLLAFSGKLEAARRIGLREYGMLAQRYVHEFDNKWLRGGAAPAEPLLGNADFQSLADLGNSFSVVTDMRVTPFGLRAVLQLAIIIVVPLSPLLLTMMPLEELLERLLKMLF